MSSYATTATVESQGQIRVSGLPFQPGTEVDVTISPRRRSAEEFTAAWQRLCTELRRRGRQNVTEEEIRDEVDRHRAGA